METKDFVLEVKSLTEEGTFEGYASVFGNLDDWGDIVDPGAFAKSLSRHAKAKTMPLLLWQHDTHSPIGVWEAFAEDEKGLRGTGRLLAGVRTAEEALILLRAKAVYGLSIGYRVLKYRLEGEIRRLTELDLMEVSIVSFPANGKARVDGVKSDRMEDFARRLRDGDPMPVKQFEDLLRDAGVPRAMATQIASVGYAKAIRSESEGYKANEDAVAFLQALLA